MVKIKDSTEVGHYLKLLVKVSAFIFLATIISKISTYGYKIIIARYFGAETYGLFSLGLIIIGIVAAAAAFGLNDGIVRYISFYRGNKNYRNIIKLINSSKKIFLFSGLISAVALILLSKTISTKIFHTDEFAPLLNGMTVALPFILLAGLYLAILRGFESIKTYSFLINIYQNVTRLVLITILVLAGFGLISITLSYVLTFAGLAALSYYYSKKEISALPQDGKVSKRDKIMPQIISYSWPLLFVGILYNIFYWSDSLILGYLTSSQDVGFYNVAVTLISLFGIAPDLFMQLLFPLVSFKLSEGKRELIRKLVQQVIKWIYLINIPLFIFLFLFPQQAIYVLFGTEYIGAAKVLQILSIGALFINLVGLSTSLLSINGRTKLVLLNFIVFSALNILLDFALIPKYGMTGAATATLLSAMSFAVCLLIQIRRIYGFNPIANYFYKLIILGAAVFLAGYMVRPYISTSLALIAVFCILILSCYLATLYLIKIFDEEDRNIIKAIFRKTGFQIIKKV